jgi:CDGSH-type Zn-finger protein/truncated hemoglobin YjbI
MTSPGQAADGGSSGGQGRLAQVLATRGGQAAPEAPFVIEHREALIYMLCEAAELEHGIMCQYLFAAFSLKQTADEGLTEAETAAVTRWRRQISHVATQEMLHLALVHNLLSAIGAAPHLGRPNLPQPAAHYPAGVQLALLPFGEQALRHFMFLERPEGMDLADAEGLAVIGRAAPVMSERDIVPGGQDFATVGHLYRSIEAGIAHLAGKYGEAWLFVGPPRAQATQANFRWPELVAVTGLSSAQRAIDTILEQGEGPRGDWRDAHFGQFVQILDEYQQMRDARPAFDPVRPVMAANVRPSEREAEVPLITDPLTARVTDLFNVAYEILLQIFERYFAHTQETDAQLAVLADATVGLMVQVIKPLGDLVTTLPAGPEYQGQNAGPSFELFYESDYLMPHREAAWALLAERLDEAAWLCEAIQAGRGTQIAGSLEPVQSALREIARTLAAHLPAGRAHARLAAPAARLEPAEAEALLARAAGLARGAAQARRAGQRDSGLAEVFDAAYSVVKAAGGLPGRGSARQNVLPLLVDGVLRPLAEALGGLPADDAGSGPPDSQAGGTAADLLWEAAKAATVLRVRLNDGGALPQLAEATAALQRLACQGVPAPEQARRLAELWELQRELPPMIQAARNGPYLVTNVPAVRNYLGQQIPAAPQLALCRCGGSSAKPFCDGTHARNGFTEAKDPKRVPDQQDTYVGQQLAILDNRGTCQHSGYCTDRLTAVFRAGQEPFVAPSGGRMDEIILAVRDCPSGALSFAIDGQEAREQVDWGGGREPAIEVTRDGPYRITGGIALTDGDGRAVARNQGASLEHYAICRCGHSQNKPFCSGMHWYVEFRDPRPDALREPTMFEWAGGQPALTRMTRLFYEKYVPDDPLLGPLFANMSADHPERVADWLGEVFGGPRSYSERHGGYRHMMAQHLGKALTEAQRARWVALICQAVQETGLPADAEFRSAFTAYIEWGSRIALENSQPGVSPPADLPMPRWDWGPAGPPGTRTPAAAPQDEEDHESVPRPGPGQPVSFGTHIRPMFRPRDRQSMTFAFDLWAYGDVKAHAADILDRLENGSMPCDSAWAPEKVQVFRRWVESDMPL